MKKTEIISAIAESTGESKAAVEKIYNATFELIKSELSKGENVSIAGFGVFKVNARKARTCRNPQTGEAINVPACKAVSFKVGSDLKKSVN